ncbi:MAG: hypothetical protein ACYC4L_08130 [Chloroflexota bacterium]
MARAFSSSVQLLVLVAAFVGMLVLMGVRVAVLALLLLLARLRLVHVLVLAPMFVFVLVVVLVWMLVAFQHLSPFLQRVPFAEAAGAPAADLS